MLDKAPALRALQSSTASAVAVATGALRLVEPGCSQRGCSQRGHGVCVSSVLGACWPPRL
eukprot:5161414-Pyramimonas_sp.AAC.1